MELHRVVVEWAGPNVVGRAVNVLHFDATESPVPPVAAIRSAYAGMSAQFPSGVTIRVPGSGETIEDTTGALTGVWSDATPAAVTGGVVPQAAAGVGACVTWNTGGIVTGTRGPRRLRGRTFLVPLANACFDTDGTLTTVARDDIAAFAADMLAAGGLGVWHRPTTTGGSDGTSYAALSATVRDKVAILTSRRD